jgi:hypothetical protein
VVIGVTTPANPAAALLAFLGRVPIAYTGGCSGFISIDPTLDRESQTRIGRGEFIIGFAKITSVSARSGVDQALEPIPSGIPAHFEF